MYIWSTIPTSPPTQERKEHREGTQLEETHLDLLFSPAPRKAERPRNKRSKMEQVFAGSSFVCYLLSEIGFLFCCPVLSWVSRIRKLYMRYFPFLLPLLGFFALVWRIQHHGVVVDDDDKESRSTREEGSKVKVKKQREEDIRVVSRRDVEMVMEKMGLGSSHGGGELKDVLGADDLNRLFEEKEPSLEEVNAAFCVFDRNGDGFIDAADLQELLSILGFKEGLCVDDCRRMIGAYDENRDGRIDFHEFVKFMEYSFC